MQFHCPTCNENIPRELLIIVDHTEKHIIDAIKEKHPEWIESQGICKKCYEYLKEQMNPS